MSQYIFETERLGFRLWQKKDTTPFIALGQDVEGMIFFSRTYTPSESYAKMCEHIIFLEDYGYGFWAVDYKETETFIGTIGFNHPSIQAFFTPCVQIGWCLKKEYWGQGLATEGAKACLEYVAKNSDLTEIYSYTVKENQPSINVMQKIHMEFVDEFVPTYGDEKIKYVAFRKLLNKNK